MTCCIKQKETVGGPTAGLLLAEQLLPVRLIQRRRQGKCNLNDVRPACHVMSLRTLNGLSTLTHVQTILLSQEYDVLLA